MCNKGEYVMAKILIADDEPKIRKLVADFLNKFGYESVETEDGDETYEYFLKHSSDIDLIILDIMMPGLNGWKVCEKIREISDVPVIMLTARSEEFDELMGYESGADDYVTKPFRPTVLMKRIEALLRRSSSHSPEPEAAEFDDKLHFNNEAHEVRLYGKEIDLTLKEYNILKTLLDNCGKVFTRDQLLEYVWGSTYDGDIRTVDSHVARLRTKLGNWGAQHLKTVYGIGYKIEADQ